MNFEEAYRAAFKMHRPCAITSTRLKGLQVVELDGDALMGDLLFISNGNMAQAGDLLPVGEAGERVMAYAVFSALGGPDWDVREWPDEISDEAAEGWQRHYKKQKDDEAERVAKWKARRRELDAPTPDPAPKKKLKKIKRTT